MNRQVLLIVFFIVVPAFVWAQPNPPIDSKSSPKRGLGKVKTELRNQAGKAKVGQDLPRLVGYPLGATQPWVSHRMYSTLPPKTRGVAVVVFATWCKPCIKGIKVLVRSKERLAKAGISVVLINFGEDAETVEPWKQTIGIPEDFTLILDEWGAEAAKLGVKKPSARLPLTVMTDRRGKVTAIFGEEGDDYLSQVIRAASG